MTPIFVLSFQLCVIDIRWCEDLQNHALHVRGIYWGLLGNANLAFSSHSSGKVCPIIIFLFSCASVEVEGGGEEEDIWREERDFAATFAFARSSQFGVKSPGWRFNRKITRVFA